MGFLSKTSDSKNKSGTANRGANLDALPLQAKLRMGRPNDAFEQEADRTADRVVNAPANESIQRQPQEEEPVQAQTEEEEEPVQAQTEEEEEPVRAQAEEEEEEPVQAQAEEEEEEPVQTQEEEEEEPVQAQAEEEEEEPVQAKAIGGSEIADPGTGQLLAASKAGGEPMEAELLRDMEDRFGSRLSHVRIHTDEIAVNLCRKFNARAFTHGRHIYFNRGNYEPGSSEGKRLLAHELTHVIQQTGRIERQMNPQADSSSVDFQDKRVGSISTSAKRITIPSIRVPRFKYGFGPTGGFSLLPGRERDDTQRKIWDDAALTGPGFAAKLNRKLKEENSPLSTDKGQPVYFLRLRRKKDSIIIGDADTIKRKTARPYWDPAGNYLRYDVDHKREIQLGGANTIDNLWLLEASANRSSGSKIKNEINNKIDAVLGAARPTVANLPDRSTVKKQYTITVERGLTRGGGVAGKSWMRWKIDQIKKGNQLKGLRALSKKEIQDANLQGSPKELAIYTNEFGGLRARVPWDENETKKGGLNIFFGKNLRINTVYYNKAPDGKKAIEVKAFKGKSKTLTSDTQLAFPLKESKAVEWGGYVQRQSILQSALMALNLKYLSRICLTEADIDPSQGLVAKGKVLPTIPIIKDADIDVIIDGDGARVQKEFNVKDIKVPKPFKISDSSLVLSIGTKGVGIEGKTNLEIEGIGKGFVRGATSTSGGFELELEFNFDPKLFTRSRARFQYKDNKWSGEAKLVIGRGKVKAIRSASIDASVKDDNLAATGEVVTDIPGVERGKMWFKRDKQGFAFGGELVLKKDLPGIESGSLIAAVRKEEGKEGYQVTAKGTAKSNIKGVDFGLGIEYDNGAILIHGQGKFKRGRLSGKARFGVTNRALDAEGKPTGEATDKFIIYGGGSLTYEITPKLKGTVGVKFLPDGAIVVSGKIALASSYNVFDRKSIPEKTLFAIPRIDIPIFAIPVGPKSIGLKAFIEGGLSFYAYIGPGSVTQLELGLVYNTEQPEDTNVTGKGRFVVPAEAGLKLYIKAGIGLNVLIGGVEGALTLSGGIALKAEAAAGINVDWTPKKGLVLKANLKASVQPKFIFAIDGSITAWVLWYEKTWKWNLAKYEYGANMYFGVELPITYRQGESFDIAFSDLKIKWPKISPSSFVKGLIRDIRSRRA